MRISHFRYIIIVALAGVFVTLLLNPIGAPADVIHLKKGGKVKGVVINESEESVEIKSNLGTIVLSRGAISRIVKATEEENKAFESQWRKEKKEKDEEADRNVQFEKEQRAKGLVKYKGTWVTPEKLAEIERGTEDRKKELVRNIDEQKRVLDEMEKQLKEIETRLDRRERELNFREQQLTMREQNLLMQQQNLQSQAEQLARDKEITPPKIFAVPRIEVVPPRK